jgi:hypothetical protein
MALLIRTQQIADLAAVERLSPLPVNTPAVKSAGGGSTPRYV